MMVAGTAASVGAAMMQDRSRAGRLMFAPALAEAAAPMPAPAALPAPRPGLREILAGPREVVAQRLGLALWIGLGALLAVALTAALTALVSDGGGSSGARSAPAAPLLGPAMDLRASAGIAGDWERAYTLAAPSARDLAAAVAAGAEEEQRAAVFQALIAIRDQRAAEEASRQQAAAQASAGPASPNARAHSMNAPSGIGAGAVMTARITIYGCQGPGGGFCNHMASGGAPFEGAAACSSNLPFGTRLTIAGDPTGRVYECLDRGALPATWVDVYFYNTSEGAAWQSSLGTTLTQITIVN